MAVEREVFDWGVRSHGTPFFGCKCGVDHQVRDRRLETGEGFRSADHLHRHLDGESAPVAGRPGVERGHVGDHRGDAYVTAEMKAEATKPGSKKKR